MEQLKGKLVKLQVESRFETLTRHYESCLSTHCQICQTYLGMLVYAAESRQTLQDAIDAVKELKNIHRKEVIINATNSD